MIMPLSLRILFVIDGLVNLLLGALLLLFPVGIIELLGLPPTHTYFYPSILGAVLSGIGAALFLELAGFSKHVRGLGLGGAIVINFIGSLVLIYWLIYGSLDIPLRGRVLLWIIGLSVFLIGVTEVITRSWSYEE
jgi:hypothetical protein